VDAVTISFGTDFTCGDLLVDDRDGQSYTTVLIDTQCVMGENINIGTMIFSGTGGLQTDNGIFEKYCQANDASNCDIYGGLYEWNEAMQYTTSEGAQGICPAGWHLPSDEEFTLLTYFLGGPGVAGGQMKSTGTLEDGTGLWHEPNTGATNESGLTGLPAGYRVFNDGMLIHLGVSANFWSSTEYYPDWAWLLYLWYENEYSHRDYGVKESGCSIRCVKD
jgi:uncharacterized protein (TIGR02145 family)